MGGSQRFWWCYVTQNKGGEWCYFMKGNVTVKINHKAFFCTIAKRSGFHWYKTLMISSLVSMAIWFLRSLFYLRSLVYKVVPKEILTRFLLFLFKPYNLVQLFKTWVGLSWVGAYLYFFFNFKKEKYMIKG